MKINQAGRVGTMTAALALAGCGNGAQDVLALKIELNALKQELEFVRQHTEELDPRVHTAEQMALQVFDALEAPARLDCVRPAPTVLDARAAFLTAVCDEAVAYDGGYRIRLQLGNPTPAHLDGLTLTFYAGEDAARGRSARRLYHETRVALPPGAWQTVDVDFDGVDDDAIKELAVRARVATVALARK
jgi:hypothetical protein